MRPPFYTWVKSAFLAILAFFDLFFFRGKTPQNPRHMLDFRLGQKPSKYPKLGMFKSQKSSIFAI